MAGVTTSTSCRIVWEGKKSNRGELLLSAVNFPVVWASFLGLQSWVFLGNPSAICSRYFIWLSGSKPGLESSSTRDVCPVWGLQCHVSCAALRWGPVYKSSWLYPGRDGSLLHPDSCCDDFLGNSAASKPAPPALFSSHSQQGDGLPSCSPTYLLPW